MGRGYVARLLIPLAFATGVGAPLAGCGTNDAPEVPLTRIAPARVPHDPSTIRAVRIPSSFVNRFWTFAWLDPNGDAKGLCVSSLGTSDSVNCFDPITVKHGMAYLSIQTGKHRFETIAIVPRGWTGAKVYGPSGPRPSVVGRQTTAAVTETLPSGITGFRSGKPVVSQFD